MCAATRAASLGGPIKKDKLFFFFNYEFLNQVQAVNDSRPPIPRFALLTNNYGSPYYSKQISARFDYHLNAKHNLFLRYSHDGNSGFGQSLEFGDPSNWPHNTNWADQGIIGLTSALTPTIVNDLRFQYNYWNNHNLQAVPSDCSAPCVAGSLPNIFTFRRRQSAGHRSQFQCSAGTQYAPFRVGRGIELAERLAPA